MSFVDHDHEKLYVATYKELLFTFIVFCIILFVLYPKDLLKEQILSEKSNYDLSILYLKNLLEHSPEDESLMLILAEQTLHSGNKDLSLRLLELLLKSENKAYREKATLLSYELQKEYYFYIQEEERLAKQKKILQDLFIEIYSSKMYNIEEAEKWYKESVFVNVERATYFFLKKILESEPQDIGLLQQAYYLAKKFKENSYALKYIALLQQYDIKDLDKWAKDEYYMHINFKEYNLAEKILKKHSSSSLEWKVQLAEFYLMLKSYKKASKIYSELFTIENNYNKKRDFFYQSVRVLQAGNYFKEASQRVKKYENFYFHDINVREFMLKIYIATGDLDRAVSLAKKILYKELK